MTVVNDVQAVMDWLAENVCQRVSLKLPPDESGMDDGTYGFRTVHPAVLGMYWPAGKEMCPPSVESPHPGLLVQVLDGEDSTAGLERSLNVRLHLSAWNPGLHDGDVWTPGDGKYVRGEGTGFAPGYDGGWRDAWNFLDVVLRELRDAKDVGGLVVDRSEPLRFGPYSEQGAIVDLYPYWFCWVDVKLSAGTPAQTWMQDYL